MTTIRDSVVLPLRVRPQPQPHLAEGGDCAACVLGGLLGLEVPEVYDQILDGKLEATSRPEWEEMLQNAEQEGTVSRVILDVPFWNFPTYYGAFGPSGYLNFPEWFRYVRMALEAGYYGVASVVYDKTGASGEIPPATDHVILICGAREVEVPHPTLPSSTIQNEVLISCSAKSSPDEEWVNTKQFLVERGGYNIMLVKPV